MQRILILATTLALALSAPAMAQQTPEDAHANAVILPMLQEVSPSDGDVLAACVVALAEPAEKAVMVAATGPSTELGTLVSTVLARPATIECVRATMAAG